MMSRSGLPFKTVKESVSPERARELLALNRESNRKLNNSRVEQYARAMREGRWKLSPDGIRIGTDGQLMDGQHRLSAVVRSGVTTEFTFFYGVPDDLFWVTDSGLPRATHSFMKGPHAGARAGAARILMRLEESGGTAYIESIYNGKYDTEERLAYLQDNPELDTYLQTYATSAASAKASGNFKSTTVMALLCAGFLVGEGLWEDWWDDVKSITRGDGLPDGNPIRALWKAKQVGGNMTRINIMRAIYAAVRYRQGKQVRRIQESAYKKVRVWPEPKISKWKTVG